MKGIGMSATKALIKAEAGYFLNHCSPSTPVSLDRADDGIEVRLIHRIPEKERASIKIDFDALERDAQI